MIITVAKDGSGDYITIQAAANVANPGDTIIVKAGIYNEVVHPINNGTVGNYITFKVYPGDSVIVDGTGLNIVNQGIFNIVRKSYIEIDGFEIQHHTNTINGFGVQIYGVCNHINLKNLKIHEILGGPGIYANPDDPGYITNILVDNCEVYNTNYNGNQEAISFSHVDTFEIKNCNVHDVHGILSSVLANKEGIDCKVGCNNGLIHNNEVYNAQQGIYIDSFSVPSSNIKIFENKCHNNYDCGILLGSEGTHQSLTGIQIFNNLSYSNVVGFKVGFEDVPANTFDFTFINNTICNNSYKPISLYSISSIKIGVISNNIIVGSGGNILLEFANLVVNY